MEGNASVTIMLADLEMAILAGADLRGALVVVQLKTGDVAGAWSRTSG